MKKILVPTDFSATARNAGEYAMEIAKLIKAEIILLHTFDVPLIGSDADMPMVISSTMDDLEKIHNEQLKNYKNQLIAKYGNSVPITSIVKIGFVFDEIKHTVKEKKIDLIIMGITGAGKFTELLIGSNATRVINYLKCPTIIVPEKAKYSLITKIAFACDYEDIEGSEALDKLIEFVELLNAKLLVINIGKHSDKPSYAKDLSEKLLEYIFENVNESLDIPENIDYSIHYHKDEDIINGVNNFVDKHKADMLVMIPKKHNLLSRLFHESNTKKMAFHSHIPLLAIHH